LPTCHRFHRLKKGLAARSLRFPAEARTPQNKSLFHLWNLWLNVIFPRRRGRGLADGGEGGVGDLLEGGDGFLEDVGLVGLQLGRGLGLEREQDRKSTR